MNEDDMRRRVRDGYEEADFPSSQSDEIDFRPDERSLLDAFLDELPANGHVLDMGCGSGIPYDRFLVDHGYTVTGVDVAETNIEAARENVPEARFVQDEFSDFSTDRTFDGLLCMFALFHLPRDEHAETLSRFHSLLTADAPMLITMGTEDVEWMSHEFYGTEMEWSFYDAETNKALILDAGFDILRTARIPDDRGDGEHLWVLAKST